MASHGGKYSGDQASGRGCTQPFTRILPIVHVASHFPHYTEVERLRLRKEQAVAHRDTACPWQSWGLSYRSFDSYCLVGT